MSRVPTCSVNIEWPYPKIRLGARLAAIGSCFAQDIATHLLDAGFSGAQNPNGIVYNAVSMADAVERAVEGPAYSGNDFFEFGGRFHSWAHHGAFSSSDLAESVKRAEASRLAFRNAIENCELFIATPASSVVYELLGGPIVANCHKVPGNKFKRRLLGVEENLSALKRIVASVRKLNHTAPVVLTLSPVRHYPGDLVLNARSKAHLLTAIHACRESCENVRYFPAYELVIDELRDYRFFKEDMLHPNDTAVGIVLNAFAGTCFEDGALDALELSDRAKRATAHRPFSEA